MNIKAVIKNLVNSKGISGNENSVCETALNLLKEYCPDAYIKNGNVIGKFGSFKENRPHILLDAHIDQVGMIVTYITDDGFIKVGNVGGLDRRLLPAQQVTIHGEKDIKGIICSVPPHLTKGKSAVLKIEEVSIDTGYSKEELEKIVKSYSESEKRDMAWKLLQNGVYHESFAELLDYPEDALKNYANSYLLGY